MTIEEAMQKVWARAQEVASERGAVYRPEGEPQLVGGLGWDDLPALLEGYEVDAEELGQTSGRAAMQAGDYIADPVKQNQAMWVQGFLVGLAMR